MSYSSSRRGALPDPSLTPPVATPFRSELQEACAGEDTEIFFEEALAPLAISICSVSLTLEF